MKEIAKSIAERQELIKANIFALTGGGKPKAVDQKPLVKAKEDDTLEKGSISDSMFGYDSKITFKKKGSKIIEMLLSSKKTLSNKVDDIEGKINDTLDAIHKIDKSMNPSLDCDSYAFGMYKDKINCVYKMFPWRLTYCSDNGGLVDGSEGSVQTTKESADLCSKYNSLVNLWVNIKCDFEAISILSENIDSNTTYELNPKQLAAIQL